MNQDRMNDYHAALDGCVYRSLQATGPFLISGEDRISFLQRQSTNDVSKLPSNGTVSTVLTNPSARIIDVLRLINPDGVNSDNLFALTLPGTFESTIAYLKSRIFFMDKVSMEDLSASFIQLDLDGPQSARVLVDVGFIQPSEENMLTTIELEDAKAYCLTRPGFSGNGYTLLVPAASAETLLKELESTGAVPLRKGTSHILRVEAGLPGPESELTNDYTPLEIGLEGLISDSKGCYTGQEVIARQITYDKVTQKLCGLRFSVPVDPGLRLRAQEKPAGSLTSYAHSPRFGHIGLGVVRKPHNQPGTKLQIDAPYEKMGTEVCALPFG